MGNINSSLTLESLLRLAGKPPAGAPARSQGLDGLSASVHLLSAEADAAASVLSGLVLGLASRASRSRPLVWATHPRSRIDGGELYGPGLAALGCDPEGLLLVNAKDSRGVLWTIEEALASGAVSAAVGELPSSCRQLNLTTTRRLAIRSETAGVPVYLLTVGTALPATACRSVWRLSSLPSRTVAAGRSLLGVPAWRATMLKNKWGSCADLTFRPRPGCRPTAGAAEVEMRGMDIAAGSSVARPPVARPSVEPAVVRIASVRRAPASDGR